MKRNGKRQGIDFGTGFTPVRCQDDQRQEVSIACHQLYDTLATHGVVPVISATEGVCSNGDTGS